MDIQEIKLASASSEGVKMELYHPIEETSFDPPIFLTVVGMDSDIYQKAQMDQRNKQFKKMQRRNRLRFEMTAEETEEQSIELLARCILGWENIEWEGAPLPYNKENAKRLMRINWIREQVDIFIGDRANFLLD